MGVMKSAVSLWFIGNLRHDQEPSGRSDGDITHGTGFEIFFAGHGKRADDFIRSRYLIRLSFRGAGRAEEGGKEGGKRPGLPRDQFSGPWLFSTAEARTINSSSSEGGKRKEEQTIAIGRDRQARSPV